MLRMQEMTFPGSTPPDPPFMRGILATHVAFSHCYPPLIYYLTERSLFKKCPPPHGKILKKGLEVWDYIKAGTDYKLKCKRIYVLSLCLSFGRSYWIAI
jgi:hypothetical protein